MHLVVPTKSGLPPREHNFCHFLVADPEMNPATAMQKIKPELAYKSAHRAAMRMLKQIEVVDYLGKLLEERQKRLEMNEDWVLNRLRDVHDRCMQHTPVYGAGSDVLDENGEPTGESEPLYYKFDAAGATKALELIGKHMKMFSDKTQGGTTQVDISISFGSAPDAPPAIEGSYKRVGSD
jgi:phage terminase small subunit